MKKSYAALALAFMFAIPFEGQESIDQSANAKIRDEGLHRSHVQEPFDMFVNVIGPRLTGSPSHKRAADYAQPRRCRRGG